MTLRAVVRALVGATILLLAAAAGTERGASAALPTGNTVEQWNQIAEDTVVGSGAFQNEGYIYMAYESTAVYDAVDSIAGWLSAARTGVPGIEDGLARRGGRRGCLPDAQALLPGRVSQPRCVVRGGVGGDSRWPGQAGGHEDRARCRQPGDPRAQRRRADDCRSRSRRASPRSRPARASGVSRRRLHRRRPRGWEACTRSSCETPASSSPPRRRRSRAPSGFRRSTRSRPTAARTVACARVDRPTSPQFETANVIRQYNGVVREITDARQLDLVQTARLAAMVNVIAADAGISVMHAKYHYLFWRPVSAIDPTAVSPDGYGPVPGYDDGNPATVEQAGWRPLLATPNHPEYPAAHGSLTGAMADVFSAFLGSRSHQPGRPRLRSQRPRRQPERGAALQHAPTTSGPRSSTHASGAASTIASPSLPVFFSGTRSHATTSHMPSGRSARGYDLQALARASRGARAEHSNGSTTPTRGRPTIIAAHARVAPGCYVSSRGGRPNSGNSRSVSRKKVNSPTRSPASSITCSAHGS